MTALPIEAGDTIDGRYRVERLLGRGGMGIVVAARHLRLGQLVAIKFPLLHLGLRSDIVARLLREARAAMQLRGEHVARVHDIGLHAGERPYLVMEFLVGHDLGRKLQQEGPLSSDAAVEYVLQACEALAEAHAAGIVHRDLKPSNLFLSRRPDGTPLMKVIDFGLAKSLDSEQHVTLTESGVLLGSPAFMAPEQMRGTMAVDARADIFSLGAALHALLTGASPFAGKGVLDVYDQMTAGAPTLGSRGADVAPELEAVVQRCLQLEPAKRFAHVAELAEALAVVAPQHTRVHAQRARGILAEAARAPVELPATRHDPTELASPSTAPPLNPSWAAAAIPSARGGHPSDVSPVVSASRLATTSWRRVGLGFGALVTLGLLGLWGPRLAMRSRSMSGAANVQPLAGAAPNVASPVAQAGSSVAGAEPPEAAPTTPARLLDPQPSARPSGDAVRPRRPSQPPRSLDRAHNNLAASPASASTPVRAQTDPLADPN